MATSGGAIRPTREPSNVTLQCPKLTTTNYTVWSVMMETILAAHGLREAIKPETGGALEDRKKYMAKALIFQSIPEDVLLQVAKHEDPKDVWEALRVRYLGAERVQKARLQTLRNELELLKMKETETIDVFAGKLSELQSSYKSLGSTLEDEVLVRKFLNSMPRKYLPIVASIEQYSEIETMSFEEVVGWLKAYEDRVKPEDSTEDTHGKLLFTREDEQVKGKNGGCDCCQRSRGKGRNRGTGRGREDPSGSSNNRQNQEPKEGRDKSRIKCYRCEDFGHFAYECPKPRPKFEEVNLAQEDEGRPLL